jgi:hypothetical protein
MYVRQRTNNKASLEIMHKERIKTSVRYGTKFDKNIIRQKQTQRIPTSCKGDGKETKGRRISVQNQKREHDEKQVFNLLKPNTTQRRSS